MPKRLNFSNKNLEFSKIAELYNSNVNAIRLFFSDSNPDFTKIFYLKSETEIDQILGDNLDEIENLFCLNLLSAFEAKLRVDFIKRCQNKLKDKISRQFRQIYKKQRSKIKFEDDILDLWRDYHPQAKQAISIIKDAFNFRHWIAHGRYWSPKFGKNNYYFNEIFMLVDSLCKALPLY